MEYQFPVYKTINQSVDWFRKNVKTIHLTYEMVAKLCKTNQVRSLKIGKKTLVDFDSLQSFLSNGVN